MIEKKNTGLNFFLNLCTSPLRSICIPVYIYTLEIWVSMERKLAWWMDTLSSNTWQVSVKPLLGLHLLLFAKCGCYLICKHAAMCDKSRITLCQHNPSEWSDTWSDSTAGSLEVWKPVEQRQSQPFGFPKTETSKWSKWMGGLAWKSVHGGGELKPKENTFCCRAR